jgi:hypothetical protein
MERSNDPVVQVQISAFLITLLQVSLSQLVAHNRCSGLSGRRFQTDV